MSTVSRQGGKNSKTSGNQGIKGIPSTNEEFPPVETRMVDCKTENGIISKVPALSKRWAPPVITKWIEFYLPDVEASEDQDINLVTWSQYMDIFIEDLKWLLQLPHYQFWSSVVYCPAISQIVLNSFLIRAPRFYEANYSFYQSHEVIWPKYQTIYSLVFRIYLRLATYKESKEDHISVSYWASLLQDHQLIGVPTILNLATLFESKSNPLFQKMIENVIKNQPRIVEEMKGSISILIEKFEELPNQLECLIEENLKSHEWNEETFEDLLFFGLDAAYSGYKLLKAYPRLAVSFLHHPTFVTSLASAYEVNTRRWGKVVAHIRTLEERVNLFRAAMLRLFRSVLANPTILSVESANDKRLDEFFHYFANCLDEKVFIHDHEKAFPFRTDMQSLLSRGIFVDETRIDYMANAISACFHACGEEYSVEKIVVDPMYDPHFDRQLLGACSLEITGIELDSLITQVKDLLPDLPNSYIEAVLKHYGYSTETTINALLEGSVPARLEKYKSEEYVRSQSSLAIHAEVEDPIQDKLPVHFDTTNDSSEYEKEKFFAGKRSHGLTGQSQAQFLDSDKDSIKKQVLQNLANAAISAGESGFKAKGKSSQEMVENLRNTYIDESLLPAFNESIEYDDEYDDTYDDLGAGMTEPDNVLFNPLNRRKVELQGRKGSPEDEEEEGDDTNQRKDLNAFCEDPAIVRARFERRRQDMLSKNNRSHGQSHEQQPSQPQQTHDVVGRARGQGQDKEVVYNRRQKTTNKGAGGSWKKRSDFKRKEF